MSVHVFVIQNPPAPLHIQYSTSACMRVCLTFWYVCTYELSNDLHAFSICVHVLTVAVRVRAHS